MKQQLNESLKKVTLDELNYILMNVPENEVILVEALSDPKMKQKYKNEDGEVIMNPYFKTDRVQKKSLNYGKINFSYEQEVKDNTGVEDFKATRSMGQKVGALVINTKGNVTLVLANVETAGTTYLLDGNEMTKEEVATQVKPFQTPYKPSQSGSVSASADLKLRNYFVKNILKIVIGNDEYHITNPNGTLKG